MGAAKSPYIGTNLNWAHFYEESIIWQKERVIEHGVDNHIQARLGHDGHAL